MALGTEPPFLDRDRSGEKDVVLEVDVPVEVGLEVPKPRVEGVERGAGIGRRGSSARRWTSDSTVRVSGWASPCRPRTSVSKGMTVPLVGTDDGTGAPPRV